VPIYEYECESCHSRFEVQQKFSDPPITTCSQCGRAVRKLISSPAIMFKGTGWYVTDYSDKMKPPSTAEAGEGKGKTENKTPTGETKTESAGAGNGAPAATPSASPASSTSGTSSGGSEPSSPPPKPSK